MKKIMILVLLISFFFVPSFLYSEETDEILLNTTSENFLQNIEYEEPPMKKSIDFYITFGKMIFATCFAVALILWFAWFMRKRAGFNFTNNMKVLDQFQFAPGKFIMIIEVYKKILIIGVSGDNISLLSEVTDEKEMKEIRFEVSHGLSGKGFDELLNENMKN